MASQINAQNTQLTIPKEYDTDRMVFTKANKGSVPKAANDNKPAIKFSRIYIGTTNDDGTVGELVLPTGRLFSYGVSECTSLETGKVNGYSMALCMWDKDGATESQKQFTDTVNNIAEKVIDHLLKEEVQDDIEKYELTRESLKKINPLFWKKEKGKIVEGKGPTLYPKLIESKKTESFITEFFDAKTGLPIAPMDLVGKFCYADCAIKFESIFIGNTISLQVKLYEAGIEITGGAGKKLLQRPSAEEKLTVQPSTPLAIKEEPQHEEEDEEPELVDKEEPTPPPVVQPPPERKPARRTTTKKN